MRSPVSAHMPNVVDSRTLDAAAPLPEVLGPLPRPMALHAASSARFRRLFEQQFSFVWRTLRRLGVTDALLPDASQRVFWTASRRMTDFTDDRARAFLFGTARRVAADFRRLRREVLSANDSNSIADDGAPTAEELVDQKRARELLDELLDALDDDLREVLFLQEGEGMTLSEIAEVLDIPLGTAASRLRRAREEFRRVLKRRMTTMAPAGGAR
jgi:RNA polymerase sigma-70 factor (ECF subfamily)